jgi:cell division transport system permease protein
MPSLKALRTALQYIRRNRWLALTNILVMTLTFFVTSIFVLGAYGSNILIKELEQQPQITAYFKDDATEMEIMQIKEKLEATGLTSKVKYVSKEEALQIFMNLSQQNPALLEGISANVLPASLEVRAKNLSDLPRLAQMLKEESLLEDLQFYRDVVERFRRLTETVRLLGAGFVVTLSLISLLVVLVTIGVSISNRGEEIETMRLVGASDWQIRGPFILQGAVLGFVSAFLSLVLVLAVVPLVAPYIRGALGGVSVPTFGLPFLLILALGQLALGALIGSAGSFVAVRKYLRI